MPKLIQKSGFIKSGKAGGYIGYIATRDGAEKLLGPEGYVEYMAMRPGAEQHDGPVWTLIYSLRREDAARLGYDNAKGWQTLLKAHRVELATAMKIPPEQFRWYAAYHNEGEHPHIHMTVWADDPKQGFLTQAGIKAIKNMVIQEAEHLRLSVLTFEDEQLMDEPPDSTRFGDPDVSNEDKRSVIEALERDWGTMARIHRLPVGPALAGRSGRHSR